MLIETTTALDTCIESMRFETKCTTSDLRPWKETVLAKAKEKITKVKWKIKHKQRKSVLSDQYVEKDLVELHHIFSIIATIVKTKQFLIYM